MPPRAAMATIFTLPTQHFQRQQCHLELLRRLSASSNYNTFIGNNATSNSIGNYLDSSNNNTLSSNNVTLNTDIGIYLSSSNYNTLTNNTMNGNLYNFRLSGDSNSDFNNQIDTTNMVDGKPVYYIKGVSDTVYDSSTNAGTFYCIDCVNVTIKNLDLRKNYYGILFWNTTRSNIQNVNASNNYYGIYLQSPSTNNTLSGNNATSNNYGPASICLFQQQHTQQ